MQELIELLKKEANLTDEQAVKAIRAMKGFLHGKVPPMFRGVVDKFFAESAAKEDDDYMP